MRFLKLESTELQPDQKIIKAAEFEVWREGSSIIERAKIEAEEISRQSQLDYEKEKQRGYSDGLMEGRMQLSEQMIGTVEKSVQYLGEIESSMVEIVLSAVRNIIGEVDDQDRIKQVVRKVLTTARDQKRVTLRVSKADAEVVRADLDEILGDFPGITFIDVESDARLKQGDCILETEIGVVEATLESQMQSLKSALRRTLEKSG
ncbi:MAG: HrpE/YscL family type III secretion apparatus protein [Verrucomicrobiota bacterium]